MRMVYRLSGGRTTNSVEVDCIKAVPEDQVLAENIISSTRWVLVTERKLRERQDTPPDLKEYLQGFLKINQDRLADHWDRITDPSLVLRHFHQRVAEGMKVKRIDHETLEKFLIPPSEWEQVPQNE